MGTMKTFLLLAVMTALFMAVGYLVGGVTGMTIAFGVALVMNIFSWWNADKIVLRMQGAREVTDDERSPVLRTFVNDTRALAEHAGMPQPKVYVIDTPQPNAFATGRDPKHAAVCATTGLLNALTREEVAGVMAHELAHVKNRDTLIMTITATLAGAISMLANFALFFGGNRNNPLGIIGTILMMILAPMAAALPSIPAMAPTIGLSAIRVMVNASSPSLLYSASAPVPPPIMARPAPISVLTSRLQPSGGSGRKLTSSSAFIAAISCLAYSSSSSAYFTSPSS